MASAGNNPASSPFIANPSPSPPPPPAAATSAAAPIPPAPRPRTSDDNDDDKDEPLSPHRQRRQLPWQSAGRHPALETPGGLATTMPERDQQFLTRVQRVLQLAEQHADEVKAEYEKMLDVFFQKAKAMYNSGALEYQNRDVRDFAAVVVRVFPAERLDLILRHVYGDAAAAMRHKTSLLGAFDTARRAATASVRAQPGAGRDAEVSRWAMFLWFGPEVCTTVRRVKEISAVMNATRRTDKVSFAELTDRLWRKVLAGPRGDADRFPAPTSRDVKELVAQLQAEKREANEREEERRRLRERRRREVEEERRRRQRREGRKRGREEEEEEDEEEEDEDDEDRDRDRDEDDEDDEDGEGHHHPRKRARISVAEALGSPEGEAGRGSARHLDDFPDFGVDSYASARLWLDDAARRLDMLAGPEDPDNILPRDIHQALEGIRLSLRAVHTRVEDFLSEI